MQSFAGLTYNNLILSNNTKTTAGNSTIIDSIKITTGTTLSVSASDTITLHSDATKTARMAQVDGSINYNTTGKFVVERYISAKRAWRFLSVPTNSSQTIKQAWQEGALNSGSDPAPGFGTQITSNRASWLADGFDVFSAGGPSMKTYNPVTDNLYGYYYDPYSFFTRAGRLYDLHSRGQNCQYICFTCYNQQFYEQQVVFLPANRLQYKCNSGTNNTLQ